MKKRLTLSAVIFSLVLNSGFAFASDSRPLFVTITSDGCHSCKKLKPIIKELENYYYGQVTFITLNIGSREELEEASQMAHEYGVSGFFDKNKSTIPKVGILCPGGEKPNKEFLGELRKEVYKNALDEILSDTNQICSL